MEYINKKLSEVSPSSKYFLLLWLKIFKELDVSLSREELHLQFHMSYKLTSKALKELEVAGVVLRERSIKKRGEPTYRYTVNASTPLIKVKKRMLLFNQKSSLDKADRKKQIINHLMEKPIDGLGVSQQLLILTLWFYASDIGVIECIGVGHLAKLIGCSKDSVRRYLKCLTSNDYLVQVSTGFTAEAFFGVRDSVYVLKPLPFATYVFSEISCLKGRNASVLTSVSNELLSLQGEGGIDRVFFERLIADFSRDTVRGYFLYWFWRYAYSTVYEVLNRRVLPVTRYELEVLGQCSWPDVNRLAQLLFSFKALKAQGGLTERQCELVRFIHKLAVTTTLSALPNDFNGTQRGCRTEDLICLLPVAGVYQKK